jgi:hypothetical protein
MNETSAGISIETKAPHEPGWLEPAREPGISSRAEPRLAVNQARLVRAELLAGSHEPAREL